jgi:hypothetical protein
LVKLTLGLELLGGELADGGDEVCGHFLSTSGVNPSLSKTSVGERSRGRNSGGSQRGDENGGVELHIDI